MSIENVKSSFAVFTVKGTPNTPAVVNLNNIIYSTGTSGNYTLHLAGTTTTLNVLESVQDVVGSLD